METGTRSVVGAIEGDVADNDRQAEYLWTLRDTGGEGILESTLMKMARGRDRNSLSGERLAWRCIC